MDTSIRVTLIALSCKGGMLHYTSQLANALSRFLPVSVAVPAGVDRSYFSNAIDFATLPIPASKTAQWPASLWVPGHLQLLMRIRSTRPDLLHILSSHPWNPLLVYGLHDVPIVATVHDPQLHSGERFSPLRLTDPITWRRCERLLVHGESLSTALIERGVAPALISVIPYGSFRLFEQWQDDNVSEVPGRILFFGRLSPYKGLEVLHRAFQVVRREVPEAHLVLAGAGQLPSIYRQHPAGITVHQTYIPDPEVARLFQQASVVVLPYIDSSQSAVLAIAFALGRPVVASRVGAIPEILSHEKTGLLVPPADEPALATALIRLLGDAGLRQSLAHAAWAYAREDMSWDRVATTTLQAYHEVLAQ